MTNVARHRLTVNRAEIIAVGTELLLGEIVDTNSAYLAEDLSHRGVNLYWSTRVGDNMGRLTEIIDRARRRADVVIICGGLGPTPDDLTRNAVAEIMGEQQTVDQGLLQWLENMYSARKRVMPRNNVQQAHVIPSAEVLPNPIGTAPGWLVSGSVEGHDYQIITLPGPPREVHRMWQHEAVPRLNLPTRHLFIRTLKTFGLGESDIAERLGGFLTSSNPTVATYAKQDGVHVRIAAQGDSKDHAASLAEPVISEIGSRLSGHVWGEDDTELGDLIVRHLSNHSRRIAIIDQFALGQTTQFLQAALEKHGLQNTRDGRAILAGSVVGWEPDSMQALGLRTEQLALIGQGTAEAFALLAAYIRSFFNTDYGLAIGKLPDHRAGSDEDGQVPTRIVIAITDDTQTTVREHTLPAHGTGWQRERAAITSLHLLRAALRY